MAGCDGCDQLFWDEIRKKKYGTVVQKRPFCRINGRQIFHYNFDKRLPSWCPKRRAIMKRLLTFYNNECLEYTDAEPNSLEGFVFYGIFFHEILPDATLVFRTTID